MQRNSAHVRPRGLNDRAPYFRFEPISKGSFYVSDSSDGHTAACCPSCLRRIALCSPLSSQCKGLSRSNVLAGASKSLQGCIWIQLPSLKNAFCSPKSNPKRTGFHPAPRSTRRAKKVGRNYSGAKDSAFFIPRYVSRAVKRVGMHVPYFAPT
ncbi:uncharacterized protein LY79DRAFT_569377 [Colletotrichum navitas]|uniref:Uncharacterized protein n=1 Tax=Colletotrichum navitas TaxID=681940 RepID=A0AAD8V088_9PEZI|nr:uncharacterized protein LY79DRAFT_569377 [Colletotrichum navitas]KAK1572984.1 hypothetical protein LY79DRAFT_569377 [Colletotrichum navitas]